VILLGISAVTNVADIIIKPKLETASGNFEVADKQHVQSAGQGKPENKNSDTFYEEKIKKMIDKTNQTLAEHSTQLSFTIHEQTKEIMVKVLDTNSGEVIKEIPSQKSLDRLAAVLENIGWIIDRKV
jgi:flagellar protein FlaG